MNEHDLELMEDALSREIEIVNGYALQMADVLARLSQEPAFKKLPSLMREEIENILTAVE